MKGKSKKASGKFYAGAGSKVASEAMNKAEGFKRGGKTVKMDGEKGACHAGRKARKSGGSVMSSAGGAGTPRGKASHY